MQFDQSNNYYGKLEDVNMGRYLVALTEQMRQDLYSGLNLNVASRAEIEAQIVTYEAKLAMLYSSLEQDIGATELADAEAKFAEAESALGGVKARMAEIAGRIVALRR